MSGTDAEADGPLAELEGRADGGVECLRGVCVEDVASAAMGGGCPCPCCGAGRGGVGVGVLVHPAPIAIEGEMTLPI
ncbi:hypothetical protein [Microbacterium sp. F2E]|uniref:hypothetical protein n=1 Tax=Microbacterium sp. F2E TaxID=2895284 RepID=UPI001E3CD875|nr:hypothetical protein [Microbacterium sp. F2E]MCC9055289.1 hypothetical protein [Microbacterium sp. F2E]